MVSSPEGFPLGHETFENKFYANEISIYSGPYLFDNKLAFGAKVKNKVSGKGN